MPLEKYERLNAKFRLLRKEYVKALGSWESNAKELEAVTTEKAFLQKKLTYFLQSKYQQPPISEEELTALMLRDKTRNQSAVNMAGRQGAGAHAGKPNK